jgi:hypothetical protein
VLFLVKRDPQNAKSPLVVVGLKKNPMEIITREAPELGNTKH